MADVRRIIVIFVIAILFTIFINVAIEAFYPQPDYETYCTPERSPRPMFAKEPSSTSCPEVLVPQDVSDACMAEKGSVEFKYDSKGCPTEAYCNTCYIDLELANERYNLIVFIVCAIAGLGALITGLYLPQQRNPINEWVGSGFLLGGILTILVGTIRYFGDMGRYTRPIVILIELVLVIYLAYKKLGKK
jgi:hypothetical protein